MLVLVLSLLPLALGPLLVAWAKRAWWTAVWLDAFVIVTVGGMVLLHILPESLERGGLLALAAFLAGLIAPVLAERGLTPTGRGTRGIALAIALVALFFHATVDGVWLRGDPAGAHGEILVSAVLLHRLLEGLGIWWVVPRTLGNTVAVVTTVVLAAGTVLGFSLGSGAFGNLPATPIAVFEGLLCGSLAHVVVHAHIPPPRDAGHGRFHVASVIGGLAGVLVMAALTGSHTHAHEHGDHAHGPGTAFMNLALQSAPALVFGYLAVGLSQSFLPSDWGARFTRGRPLVQALRGIAIGLPLPICSCGVLPIYRDLMQKGASLAGGIAFLIATPELEIAAILLSFRLLGPEVTLVRIASAGLLALLTALLVHKIAGRQHSPLRLPAAGPEVRKRRSVRDVLRYGFVDAVEDTGSWLLAGLGLAAILAPYLDPSLLRDLPAGLDVPLAALLGLPLYVCASGSTPLAAVLVAQGVSPGAAIAFLLTGPATNITTYGVLARLHGRTVAMTFTLTMALLSIGLGYGANALLGRTASAVIDPHHHSSSVLEIACLVVIAAALLFFFLRVGVRGVLARLFMAHADEHEGHAHAHAKPGTAGSEPACCDH